MQSDDGLVAANPQWLCGASLSRNLGLIMVAAVVSLGGCHRPVPEPEYGRLASAVSDAVSLSEVAGDAGHDELRRAASEASALQVRYETTGGDVKIDPEQLIRAWSRATSLAWKSSARSRRHLANLESVWNETDDRVSEQLERARLITRRSTDPESARSLTRAMVTLAVARQYAHDKRWERAITEAERASHLCEAVLTRRSIELERLDDPALIEIWRGWVADTIRVSKKDPLPVLVVDKNRRSLEVYRQGKLVSSLEIDLGFNGLREKRMAGDRATPEGFYRIVDKKNAPDTSYYKALLLDYPNAVDVERFRQAQRDGAIPANATIGGLIEIHGEGGRSRDWTDGCIAVTNEDMDFLFEIVTVGSLVTIVGRSR